MPHELQGRDVRPGVMSRFPHTFQAYQATLDEVQVRLSVMTSTVMLHAMGAYAV